MRNKQFKKISNLNPKCEGLVSEFIGTYIKAEIFAKKIQKYYKNDKKEKNINISTLKNALNHFNISTNIDIDKLFKSGKPKRGEEKSARELRNGYIHSLSDNYINEIESNANFFIDELKAFMEIKLKYTSCKTRRR